jgi:hypothetical protein
MALMGLRLGSPLVCFINICGVGLEVAYPAMIETLSATSHGPDIETLARHEVLAYQCTTFHPCMCGLRRGTAAVATVLIGYIDVGLLPG